MADNPLRGHVPLSIGIIMDGNRRLARRFNLKPWKGHEMGVKKLEEVLDWCSEFGIKYVTVYAFSTENFNRPRREFKMIMKLFKEEFLKIANNLKHKAHLYKVRVRGIGRREMLPDDVREAMEKAEEATKSYKDYFLNLAIAYGGQQEITDACRKVAEMVKKGRLKPDEINEKIFTHFLYLNGTPSPDLIIRTGGEHRLSNFLLWHSAYSELAFVDEMWPEFSKETFVSVLKDFQRRQRRFGR